MARDTGTAAAKIAPDVINLSVSEGWVSDYASRGVLLNLDEKVPQAVKDIYFPGLWKEQLVDGKNYQFPWYQGLNVELINKRLFEKAGLDPANFPKTNTSLFQWFKIEADVSRRRVNLMRGSQVMRSFVAAVGGDVPTSAMLGKLFTFFLKAGSLTFGSGLVIVPFLEKGLVQQTGWLNEREFLVAKLRENGWKLETKLPRSGQTNQKARTSASGSTKSTGSHAAGRPTELGADRTVTLAPFHDDALAHAERGGVARLRLREERSVATPETVVRQRAEVRDALDHGLVFVGCARRIGSDIRFAWIEGTNGLIDYRSDSFS